MLQAFFNLFYPEVCAGCDALLLSDEYVICTECRHEIPLTYHSTNAQNEAMSKFYGRVPIENAIAFIYFHKKGIVQQLIHRLKYRGQQQIGTAIGHWFSSDLKPLVENQKIQTIVPVPIHSRRLRERGYNQVSTFGQSLAKDLQIKYDPEILSRAVYSKTQTRKGLFGRSDLKENVFESHFSPDQHNMHFLLIDDVLTTGATLEACSRALLEIPGARVSIACMAFTQS